MQIFEGNMLDVITQMMVYFSRDNAITIFQCLRGYEGLVLSVDVAPGFTFMSERNGLDYIIVMD